MLLNKAAPNDLLFTPAPLSFPHFVDQALSIPQETRESLRAPCDDQRVLERSWQAIICLLVASCLASHFSRVPFLIFLPGELFHICNGLAVFLFPDMLLIVTMIDLRCVYLGKICRALFSAMCACSIVQKSPTRFQNQRRLVTEEEFSCDIFSSPLLLHQPQCKGESFLLKMFPDSALLVWRKYMRRVNVILAEQIRNVFHGHIPILVQS